MHDDVRSYQALIQSESILESLSCLGVTLGTYIHVRVAIAELSFPPNTLNLGFRDKKEKTPPKSGDRLLTS